MKRKVEFEELVAKEKEYTYLCLSSLEKIMPQSVRELYIEDCNHSCLNCPKLGNNNNIKDIEASLKQDLILKRYIAAARIVRFNNCNTHCLGCKYHKAGIDNSGSRCMINGFEPFSQNFCNIVKTILEKNNESKS